MRELGKISLQIFFEIPAEITAIRNKMESKSKCVKYVVVHTSLESLYFCTSTIFPVINMEISIMFYSSFRSHGLLHGDWRYALKIADDFDSE